jgi:transcriptional regulator with XRE-family HTH domain
VTPDTFKALRERFWPTQADAAAFFGKGERMIRHYERGTVPVPQEIQILLKLMLALDVTPDWIRKKADVT